MRSQWITKAFSGIDGDIGLWTAVPAKRGIYPGSEIDQSLETSIENELSKKEFNALIYRSIVY